ncbi:MAG: Asp-tRNA(Asn)/Glu-tRNA(Gln) amidotransferase subunit GatA [Candidatus Magasanikbacteria bacterium]
MDIANLTIPEARKKLDNGEITSVDLTQACLDKIEQENDDINAFITVVEDLALKQAREADNIIEQGDAGPLTGLPFGAKDTLCIKDIRSTGGAKILDNYEPPYTSTVVQKVLDQNAVLLGKQNCDAFGHGASNENSMYGPVKNPRDTDKVAGGSSGGSAAAVAAGMCLFSIGEDTGGSIRQPASFCGTVGLRPSYGRNSRYGVMPMASSLDTVGPMAKSVAGTAILEEVMAGKDEKDATTVDTGVPQYSNKLDQDISDLTIGLPKEYFEKGELNREVHEIIDTQFEELANKGCEIKEVSLPHTEYAVSTYYIIVPSEDSSNMARLDGMRYGTREEGKDLESTYGKSRAEGFPDEVKRRIMIGTYSLSAGYYDKYYKKAQKVRTLIKQDFEHVFEEVDVLLTPTSPFPPFELGEKTGNVLDMYLADVFTVPAALAGIPALSVPVAENGEGLPVGAQIIGPRLKEDRVLKVGAELLSS